MKELLFILLGMGIWQLVVFITIMVTEENEQTVYNIGMGLIGWLIYGILILFIKIFKLNSKENKAKRTAKKARKIERSAKRQIKKRQPHWKKWYKKYGKYSYLAWNLIDKELIDKMKATGFDHNNSKN